MLAAWGLALSGALGLIANVAMQIAVFRAMGRVRLLRSVILGFAAGAIVAGLVTLACAASAGLSSIETLCQLVANLSTAGALGYGYFHFINLGETARRIRLLRELTDAGGALTHAELLAQYDAREMIRIRLDRLLGTRQLELRDGRFFVRKAAVLRMAQAIDALKLVIMGKASEFD